MPLFPVPETTRHLGDGVYATFDGYGLELRVNSHRSPQVTYLEPSVVHAMSQFLQAHNDALAASAGVPHHLLGNDGPEAS